MRSSSVQLIASDPSKGEEVEAAVGLGGAPVFAPAVPSCSAEGDGDGDGDGGGGDGGSGGGSGGGGGGGGGSGGGSSSSSASTSAEERYKIRRGAMLDCGDLLFKGSKKARIKRPNPNPNPNPNFNPNPNPYPNPYPNHYPNPNPNPHPHPNPLNHNPNQARIKRPAHWVFAQLQP